MDQTEHEKNHQKLIKKGVKKASPKAKSGRKTTALLSTPALKKVRQTGAFRKNQPQILRLKGKTAVFIDWANVYNWKNSLKKEVDLKKLFKYLKSYPQIKEINFYFGTDHHPASKNCLSQARKIGYRVITKEVKMLPVTNERGVTIAWKRKCDFDLEIGLDCFEKLEKFEGFIIFSGDGDFATLYQRLIKNKKQVIVIYMYGHLGREIWAMKRGIFKASIKKLKVDLYKKMTPSRRPGA